MVLHTPHLPLRARAVPLPRTAPPAADRRSVCDVLDAMYAHLDDDLDALSQ